jgi:cytochrome P450
MAARDAESGEALSDVDVRNEVVTLFLAGHETTALLLTWGFTLLGRHPEIVQRLREEVASVVGDRAPSMDDCQRLTYMRQTIDEILRLRSPTWTVARDAQKADEISGFRVRPGDIVMPMNYLTHRHPEFWPDPERFDPLRFTPEAARLRPRAAYYPFSTGPRMCIGNTFSIVEAQVILTLLLQRTEFSLATDAETKMVAGVTMRPGAPVPLRIKFK